VQAAVIDPDAGPLVFDLVASGPDAGEPVLLLHGFPQGARSFEAVTPLLTAEGLRTYAVDQRGYSPGARPVGTAHYRSERLVADALGVLDALELPAVHVVGHDWGAHVGWLLAGHHPDRVRSLTALSVPHPRAFSAAYRNDPDQRERSSYITLFRMPGKAEQVLSADSGRRLRGMLHDCPPEAIDGYVARLLQPGALTAALEWYRAMPVDELDAPPVEVPTTYVWSDADQALGRAGATATASYCTGPYRFVELPGVSHAIPEQAPDAVAGAVLALVAATRR
jgi:pimeloyl-ACP methyl ester carboxylesterase